MRSPVRAAQELTLVSGVPDYDQAFAQAVRGVAVDVRDGVFLAGTLWPQVWTRDTAYAVDLGASLLNPQVAHTTLRRMVETDPQLGEVWLQDKCGHFGGWPNLTDAIVGTLGAWRLYIESGDRTLLAWSYEVTKRSLARAERDAWDSDVSGLFKGCSTFMESNSGYPRRFRNDGFAVGQTKALSTNLLYQRAYALAAQMGQRLQAPAAEVASLQAKADDLKDSINARLWQPQSGYYAYFEDERGELETAMEGTGEAFAILWGVANQEQAQAMLARVPTTDWGLPSLWPRYAEWLDYGRANSMYYHNGTVWPFVQAYWGWAAAKARSVAVFGTELDKMVACAQHSAPLGVGLHEFYRPEDGLPDGSPNQLWSNAGMVSMVVHGLFGVEQDEDAVRFAPVVPPRFDYLTLHGLQLRAMTLTLHVQGHGTSVKAFRLDGVTQDTASVPTTLKGEHTIEIALGDAP